MAKCSCAHVTDYQKQVVGPGEKWRWQRQPSSMILQVFLMIPIQMPFMYQQHLTWCIQATPSDQRATYNMKFLNFIASLSLWKVFAVCTPSLSLSGNSSLASVNEYFLCFIFESPHLWRILITFHGGYENFSGRGCWKGACNSTALVGIKLDRAVMIVLSFFVCLFF